MVKSNFLNLFFITICLELFSCAGQKSQLSKDDKKDSDSDGIINAYDKCSDTPLDVLVDAFGCPLDTDGDGVPDYKDKEPNSREGARVDADGIEIMEVKEETIKKDTLEKIVEIKPLIKDPSKELEELINEYALPILYYKINQHQLNKFQKYQLEAAVSLLKIHPGIKIIVEGFTDKAGPANFNLTLSEKRAKEASNYLLNKPNTKPNQVEYSFYGENKPASGSSEEKYNSYDRRTELRYKISLSNEALNAMVNDDFLKYKDPVFELQKLVDEYGITVLNYNINQSALSPEHKNKLNKITPVLTVHPRMKLLIEGHTDKLGDENYNMKLSEKRAKTAADYMKSKKVTTDKQITYKYYGETKPASGSTEEKSNSMDRRTEINFRLIEE